MPLEILKTVALVSVLRRRQVRLLRRGLEPQLPVADVGQVRPDHRVDRRSVDRTRREMFQV